ncbi:MAG: hypothetical protein ACE5HV_16315, partial [Acidobacteriota bacterium]
MSGALQCVRTVVLAGLLLSSPAPAAEQVTVLRAGRLLDVETGGIETNVDILVRGNRIAEIGRDLDIPDGAARIDLSGRMVLLDISATGEENI